MKKLNKLVSGFCSAMLGLLMLTGCEGSELYKVGAPDWLDSKIDSIKNANIPEPGLYSIGTTSLNSPFWTLGKSHVVPAGGVLEITMDLKVNPDSKYYKNFYTVITNDVSINPRGGGYYEYGVMRFDNDPTKNSEWGDIFTAEDRKTRISANFTNTSGSDDIDPTVQNMNGIVKVTVDRTGGGLKITYAGEKCTKTYTRETLENKNPDASNENIRITLGVEGAFVNVKESNIEPVDDTKDYEPFIMTLKGVSAKYKIGTTIDDIINGISADVDFGEGGIKNIPGKNLTIDIIPDMTTLGQKTIIAAYNKTSKGESAKKAVVASATFELTDKMYTILGNDDNSGAFWSAHSEKVQVDAGETFIQTFTNYTSGEQVYHNFLVVLTGQADNEYAVLRADDYGWGTGYNVCTHKANYTDQAAWLAAMNGAKVTTYVTNNGNNTADVKYVMVGNDNNVYEQEFIGVAITSDDFYFHYTIERAHLTFDNIVGAEDNSGAFWSDHSTMYTVPEGATYSTSFINYSDGAEVYHHFLVVLSNIANSSEYCVLRADNYGWGASYEGCTHSASWTDLAAWNEAMDGAKVTVSVTNKGDGTASVHYDMECTDGNIYTQDYDNIAITPNDFAFRFTIEKAHIVFE